MMQLNLVMALLSASFASAGYVPGRAPPNTAHVSSPFGIHNVINLNHIYADEQDDDLRIILPTGEHANIQHGPAGCCVHHNHCDQIHADMDGNIAAQGSQTLAARAAQTEAQVCCTRVYAQTSMNWVSGSCTGHGPWVQKSVRVSPGGTLFMEIRWPDNP